MYYRLFFFSFLLIMIVFLSDILKVIPMPMLVAVMLVVSVGTFNWQSVKELKIHPIGFNVVMLVTIAIVVYILGCDSCFRPR